MSWTYNDFADPDTRDRDEVRSLIGDTTAGRPVTLSDEQIDYYLDQEGSVLSAAIRSARALGARYAEQVDQTDGTQRAEFSQRAAHYADLVEDLRRELAERAFPGGGTMTEAEAEAYRANSA